MSAGGALNAIIQGWLRGYDRAWLGADAIAGLIIWSVVTPQCVAYAQIAGLPPASGLMAAPGGPLALGGVAAFAALSPALALVAAVVLVGAGLLRLGGLSDLVSKPVMTGFLFGLG